MRDAEGTIVPDLSVGQIWERDYPNRATTRLQVLSATRPLYVTVRRGPVGGRCAMLEFYAPILAVLLRRYRLVQGAEPAKEPK